MTAPIALEPGAGEAAGLGPVRFVLKASGEQTEGGFEGFFKKGAEAIDKGKLDLEFRDRLAEEFGVTYFDDVKF